MLSFVALKWWPALAECARPINRLCPIKRLRFWTFHSSCRRAAAYASNYVRSLPLAAFTSPHRVFPPAFHVIALRVNRPREDARRGHENSFGNISQGAIDPAKVQQMNEWKIPRFVPPTRGAGNPPKCHERDLFSCDTLTGISIEIISNSVWPGTFSADRKRALASPFSLSPNFKYIPISLYVQSVCTSSAIKKPLILNWQVEFIPWLIEHSSFLRIFCPFRYIITSCFLQ